MTLHSSNELVSNENGGVGECSSALIEFSNEQVTIDRQDTKNGVLRATDNLDYICCRKDNKLFINCHVTPLRDDGGDVQVRF